MGSGLKRAGWGVGRNRVDWGLEGGKRVDCGTSMGGGWEEG